MNDINRQIDAKIFEFAFELAVRDITELGRFSGFSGVITQNDKMKKVLKKYIDDLLNFNVDENSFWEVANCCKDISKEKSFYGFELEFWHIQNLINRTAQYMYVISYRNQAVRKSFALCHCPMDTKIIERTIDELKNINDSSDDKEIKDKVSFYLSKDNLKLLKKPITHLSFADVKQYELFQDVVSFLSEQKEITAMEYYYLMK